VMYWTALDSSKPKPPVCTECTDGTTPADAKCAHAPGGSGPTFMSWAPGNSPDGPWSTPQELFKGQAWNMDTNLAMVILSNGSAVGIGRTGGDPTGIVVHLVTAANWKEPSSYVGQWHTMLFPNTTILPASGMSARQGTHKGTHTARILCSYCAHTALILYSSCTHTLYSYCTHTVLPLQGWRTLMCTWTGGGLCMRCFITRSRPMTSGSVAGMLIV
jgi:hypothetical protein